jgi:hypothetical protein
MRKFERVSGQTSNLRKATTVARRPFAAPPEVLRAARQIMERVEGIEPSSSAWKAAALPLSYTRSLDLSGGVGGGGWIRTSVR